MLEIIDEAPQASIVASHPPPQKNGSQSPTLLSCQWMGIREGGGVIKYHGTAHHSKWWSVLAVGEHQGFMIQTKYPHHRYRCRLLHCFRSRHLEGNLCRGGRAVPLPWLAVHQIRQAKSQSSQICFE